MQKGVRYRGMQEFLVGAHVGAVIIGSAIFSYVFLGPGTIVFQVSPGNYQGAPEFFHFL